GLGGLRLNGNKWVNTITARAAALNTFTLEIEFTPDFTVIASPTLVAGPRYIDAANYPWALLYDQVLERVQVIMAFQDARAWGGTSAGGSVTHGQPARVTIVRDGSAGTTQLFVGRTLAATDTRAAAIKYDGGTDRPLRLGGPVGAFSGTLG